MRRKDIREVIVLLERVKVNTVDLSLESGICVELHFPILLITANQTNVSGKRQIKGSDPLICLFGRPDVFYGGCYRYCTIILFSCLVRFEGKELSNCCARREALI